MVAEHGVETPGEVYDAISDVVYFVRAARAHVVAGGPVAPERHSDYVLGECVENARALQEEFTRTYPEWSCRIIRGGLDLPEARRPDTRAMARADGVVHHWVAVDTQLGTYHCDLASESRRTTPAGSEPFIGRALPPEYICFEPVPAIAELEHS
jgi:hypothetical protein